MSHVLIQENNEHEKREEEKEEKKGKPFEDAKKNVVSWSIPSYLTVYKLIFLSQHRDQDRVDINFNVTYNKDLQLH